MLKKIFMIYALSAASLFAADFDENLINDYENIPLENKIGQMLLVGFSGTELNDEAKEYINTYHVGGIILFSRALNDRIANIESPEQVKKLNEDLQNEAGDVKIFIAVDQEGGYVARLNEANGFFNTKSAAELGMNPTTDATYEEAKKIANLLQEYGFNLNFAPSVDVNVNPNNPVIAGHGRSFSDNPNIVVQHALAFIKAHDELGIITTLKHFPGHGSSTGDSHEGFVDITKTYKKYELQPFRDIIKTGYKGGVLTAHVVNTNVDTLPASLSKKFIDGILRSDLGFRGVVFSDDLKMKAIEDNFTLEEALVDAINAGTDVIVYGNNIGEYNPHFVKDASEIIKKNVEEGNISMDRINESYLRIMTLKKEMLYRDKD
ncbi:MAG: glycoside hydrolase family 3 protein [Alphaproteobacteria bacterium]|jgi:beta-N-acetylhexosaminidase|nr:glycoside hydrolase family 3 protein [Alphaproteobacteria bacterium]